MQKFSRSSIPQANAAAWESLALRLHPCHMSAGSTTPVPLRRPDGFEAFSTHIHIHSFVDDAKQEVQTYCASASSHAISSAHATVFTSAGLVVQTVNEDGSLDEQPFDIPLRFAEVDTFEVHDKAFIVVGLREKSAQHVMNCFAEPLEAIWIISIGATKPPEQLKPALLALLAHMGSLGAIRSDLSAACKLSQNPIGRGGTSTIYVGQVQPFPAALPDTRADADGMVAVKVLDASLSEPSSQMLVVEAGFLMDVAPHPNIIGFLGLFISERPDPACGASCWAMMMGYCSAGDLHNDLSGKGPCNECKAADTMMGLLSALVHLHSLDIVHRDVKAENILLTKQDQPVLSDFGIAARLTDAVAMTKRCGSPGYCAPEMLSSGKYNAKVDIFSSGVVLYYMLSCQLPFSGPDISSVLRRTMRCRVKMDSSHFGGVSRQMKLIILSHLNKDVDVRPDASSALQEMGSLITHKRAKREQEEQWQRYGVSMSDISVGGSDWRSAGTPSETSTWNGKAVSSLHEELVQPAWPDPLQEIVPPKPFQASGGQCFRKLRPLAAKLQPTKPDPSSQQVEGALIHRPPSAGDEGAGPVAPPVAWMHTPASTSSPSSKRSVSEHKDNDEVKRGPSNPANISRSSSESVRRRRRWGSSGSSMQHTTEQAGMPTNTSVQSPEDEAAGPVLAAPPSNPQGRLTFGNSHQPRAPSKDRAKRYGGAPRRFFYSLLNRGHPVTRPSTNDGLALVDNGLEHALERSDERASDPCFPESNKYDSTGEQPRASDETSFGRPSDETTSASFADHRQSGSSGQPHWYSGWSSLKTYIDDDGSPPDDTILEDDMLNEFVCGR